MSHPGSDKDSSASPPVVLTIGYGSDDTAMLLARLDKAGADYVVDIRSKPYSRYHPEFNGPDIAASLKRAGVGYLFLGDQLGGRPDDSSCYNEDGQVRYDVLAAKTSFKEGLCRVETGVGRGYKVALLCSEGRPERCHRSKLVGKELALRGNVQVIHVDPDGYLVSQDEVVNRINGGQQSLGFVDALQTSIGSYNLDGSRV